MKPKRQCAIYTCTSTEEGLSQDFNSLHAQAEACAAFIKSQAIEGWIATRRVHEDGGYSGGSMERPALQELLEDISEGRVNVVVVYKVDRLTPSLADFAKSSRSWTAKARLSSRSPPLGYDLGERALLVNAAEAKPVSFIFRRLSKSDQCPRSPPIFAINVSSEKFTPPAKATRGAACSFVRAR